MSEFERITDLPLVERIKKAHYLTRELSEHLRQAYLPRVGSLRKASKHLDPKDVSDQQILDHTLAVLEAEDFTAELYGRLRECVDSIRDESREIVYGSELRSPTATRETRDDDGLFS